MSEIQPKNLFSDTFIQETTKLRYERVLHEPKTQCTRCGAELILSRLPWQSRCLKCKEAWTGMAVYQYHTQVVGLVPRLPRNHHLRMGFSVRSGGVCTSETGTSVGCSFELSTSSPSVSDSGLSTCSGAWPTSSRAV